jgi:hypothetical protein
LIDYLITVSTGTPVLGAPHHSYVAAILTNDIHAVVGGGVVEYENAVVVLRQDLWDQVPKILGHIEVWYGRDDR